MGTPAVEAKKVTRFAIVILMLAMVGVPVAAASEQTCGPYQAIVTRLSVEFGERLIGRGIDGLGRMMEIHAGKDGWTVLLVQPANMLSCIMLVGQKGTQWQTIDTKSVGPRS